MIWLSYCCTLATFWHVWTSHGHCYIVLQYFWAEFCVCSEGGVVSLIGYVLFTLVMMVLLLEILYFCALRILFLVYKWADKFHACVWFNWHVDLINVTCAMTICTLCVQFCAVDLCEYIGTFKGLLLLYMLMTLSKDILNQW